MIEKYQLLSKDFYYSGTKSFMTKCVPGNGENFYLHVLGEYVTFITKSTYENHGLGVGVFIM